MALSAVAVVSCNGFGMQKDYKYESTPLDPHIDMTTWEFITDGYLKDSLSIFKSAIEYAGLEDMYQQTEKVCTYLLINNTGMKNFIKSKGFDPDLASITDIDVELVTRLLQYHVISGEYHAYNMKLPVEPIYVKNNLEGEWGLMTIKVNKSSQNSIGHPISNGNIVVNETGSNFRSKRISSVTSNIMPTNGYVHIFNDFSRFSKNDHYSTAY